MGNYNTVIPESLPQTPKELAAVLSEISDDALSAMPHALLYQTRAIIPKDKQERIANFEHRAFAREAVGENPLMALPIAAAIPAYQAYKAVVGARSKGSMSQATQALIGIGEGVSGSLSQLLKTKF